MNASTLRRRALLAGSDTPPRTTPRPPPAEQEVETSSEVEPGRRSRLHDRPYAAQIECPVCAEWLELQSSILQSLRCEECGHLLTFEEVMALRRNEHTRASRYV